MASKKINITIRPDVLDRIDKFCEDNNITRSGLFQLAVTQYINALEIKPDINKALALMGSLADQVGNGVINPEEYRAKLGELEAVQRKLEKA